MAEDLASVTSDLKQLMSVTISAQSAFGGLGKSLASIANSSSKASKNWTIFSRLVSGTPIWAIQNKVRAYVDILAQVDEKQKSNTDSRKAYNKAIINEMKSYDAIKGQMIDVSTQFENYAQAQNSFASMFGSHAATLSHLSLETRELLESTDSYTLAIKAGYTEFEAYSKAMEEVNQQYTNLEKNAIKAQKALEYERKMQTAQGRKEIRDEQRKELSESNIKSLNNFGKKTSELLEKIFRQNGQTWEVRKKFAKGQEKYDKFATRFQTKMLNFANFTKGVFQLLQKYIIMGMFVAIGIIAAIAVIKQMSEQLDFSDIMERIGGIIALIASGIGDIVGLFSSLMSGDLEAAMEYLHSLLESVNDILIETLKIALMVGFELIVATIKSIPELLSNPVYSDALYAIIWKALKAYAIIIGVKMVAVALLQVAALYALPALIGIVIVAGLVGVFKRIFGKRETGGVVRGNESMTLVGERGPELVSLPTGSKVYTNNQTNRMTGGVTNNFNITINAKDTSDAELRRIADKLGGMISSKINRRNSSSTMR